MRRPALLLPLLSLLLAAAAASPADARPSLVLDPGIATSELLAWSQSGARLDARLVLHAADGTVVTYRLDNAWPSKITGAVSAGKNEIAIETLELAAERVDRIVTNNNDPDGLYVTNGTTGTGSVVVTLTTTHAEGSST
jgi:hypothetical protein